MSEPKATEISHAWQAHRRDCIKLAIKASAPVAELIETAEKISHYIMTSSEIEKKQIAAIAAEQDK